MDFLKFLPPGVLKAMGMKAVRWAATAAGTAATTWLLAHHVSPTDTADIAGYGAALILALGSAAFSFLDAKRVGDKMVVATTTAYDQGVATDPADADEMTRAEATKAALAAADTAAPKEAQVELARLRAGGA